jgi:tetratricopeptide (TPR) repeat protein
MTWSFLVAVALTVGDPPMTYFLPPVAAGQAAEAPELARKAELSFLVRRWDRAVPMYEQLVAANPTVGLHWYRLGTCCLSDGKYERAAEAFAKADELGGYQWNPTRIVYHGEAAWGAAAAHARMDHRDEAIRWTRTALAQGLRDIYKFHGPHFEKLLEDPEYRKLVWKVDTKDLSRDDGLKLDLKFLMHEGKRIHYAPFRTTSEAEIDQLAARLDQEISQLSDDQVFVRMMGIMRRFGDGHTILRRTDKPLRLGVQFFRFPEGLYITAAMQEHADLIGAKVLRIGDKTADEAIALVENIVSRDNPMTVLSSAPMVLGGTRILRGLGVAPVEGPVPLEIEDLQGKTRRIELEPTEKGSERGEWTNKIPERDDLVPLSRRQLGKMYWFETLEAERAVFCQINGIGNDPKESFSKFCKRLFEAVEKPEVDALIIDVRHNGGGDTFENVPLIEGIIRCQKLQQPGKLFVIIGRLTFSAAQNTTGELERRTKAILVGEPTGSRPNFIGESLRIPLPYTKWSASISDLWWQHSMAMDYRIWTNPQLYAPPSAELFRAYRDPAMEAIAAYRAKAAK